MAFDFLKSRGDPFDDQLRDHMRDAYRPEGLNSEFARNMGRDSYNRALQSNEQIVAEDFNPSQEAAKPLINDVEGGLMRSSTALGGDQMYNSALSEALGRKARSSYARGESGLKRELEQQAPLKRAERTKEAFGYMSHAEEVRQEEADRRQQIENAIHGINMQQQASRAAAIKSIFQAGGMIGGMVAGGIAGGPAGAAAGGQAGGTAGGGIGDAATGGKSNYTPRRR